jgi:hypothetical protein
LEASSQATTLRWQRPGRCVSFFPRLATWQLAPIRRNFLTTKGTKTTKSKTFVFFRSFASALHIAASEFMLRRLALGLFFVLVVSFVERKNFRSRPRSVQ